MLTQLKKGKSAIYSAILKYGRSNFSLEILEYGSIRESEVLLEQETYYINLLKPNYNISLTACAPMTGRNHSEETKKRISEALKKIDHCGRFPKGHKHSEETLAKLRGRKHSEETKIKMSEALLGRPRPEGSGSPSKKIEVFDNKTNLTTTYESIREAARALDIKQCRISTYFSNNQKSPYKGRYIFNKIFL
jgi:group I intron endonuclease